MAQITVSFSLRDQLGLWRCFPGPGIESGSPALWVCDRTPAAVPKAAAQVFILSLSLEFHLSCLNVFLQVPGVLLKPCSFFQTLDLAWDKPASPLIVLCQQATDPTSMCSD